MLDKDKKEILPAVSYRDNRTSAVKNEVAQITSQQDLYSKTGIQKQNFNTIYQLYCDKKSGKLDNAEYFLMIPDYLSFKLTGIIKNEYTNATTTNLVNAQTKEWDKDILDKLEIKNIFRSLSLPKTVVGESVNLLRQRLTLMPRVFFVRAKTLQVQLLRALFIYFIGHLVAYRNRKSCTCINGRCVICKFYK